MNGESLEEAFVDAIGVDQVGRVDSMEIYFRGRSATGPEPLKRESQSSVNSNIL